MQVVEVMPRESNLSMASDNLATQWARASTTVVLNLHAVNSPAGKVLWVSVPGKLLAGFEKPLKLSEVILNCDDIFIMFKASTQQGADWSISWAFV